MSASAPRTPRPVKPATAAIVASLLNALEWYDLVVFGFLSVILSHKFFPPGNEGAALLLTFATFGTSFVVRPLGGLYFGVYGDRVGRARALAMAALLMMAGTATIAFIPTYASIGVWATVAVVFARLLQGFSAGGGFSSGTAFLVEQSPAHRGFFASWQIASQGLTTLLGAGAGVALNAWFSPAQIDAWAWRLPFVGGLLIGPLSLFMILRIPEPPGFTAAAASDAPLRESVRLHGREIVVSIGATVVATVCTYLLLYVPTYAVRELKLPAGDAFMATLAAGAIQMLLAPLFGHLGDRFGRGRWMLVAAVLLMVSVCPLYAWLVARPQAGVLLAVQSVIAVVMTAYFAMHPAFLADLFPARVRSTSLSLAYNAAVTLFGGFAPFIMAGLVQSTGSPLAPSFYVTFAAAVSVATLAWARRQPGQRGVGALTAERSAS